jgi:hypothetical protein
MDAQLQKRRYWMLLAVNGVGKISVFIGYRTLRNKAPHVPGSLS